MSYQVHYFRRGVFIPEVLRVVWLCILIAKHIHMYLSIMNWRIYDFLWFSHLRISSFTLHAPCIICSQVNMDCAHCAIANSSRATRMWLAYILSGTWANPTIFFLQVVTYGLPVQLASFSHQVMACKAQHIPVLKHVTGLYLHLLVKDWHFVFLMASPFPLTVLIVSL